MLMHLLLLHLLQGEAHPTLQWNQEEVQGCELQVRTLSAGGTQSPELFLSEASDPDQSLDWSPGQVLQGG